MGVGARLREARQRRGVTLRQVADFTKVPVHTLEIIEQDDFGRLPGGIITRGYLRSFAAAVEQNPEEIVREYLAQYPLASAPEDFRSKAPVLETDHARPFRDVVALLVSILLVYALYTGFEAPTQAPAVATGDPTAGDTPNLPRQSMVAADEPVPVADPVSRGVYLEIQPTGLCWVSARADGQLVLHRLVAGGERVTVSAREQVVLRVGEPGRFAYTLNGIPGRPVGDPGKPVTVTITDVNYGAYQTGREGSLGDELRRRATGFS